MSAYFVFGMIVVVVACSVITACLMIQRINALREEAKRRDEAEAILAAWHAEATGKEFRWERGDSDDH